MRCIAVLLVVVFHSTSAYVGADYFVMDRNSSPVTKIIGSLLVMTSLNILFFVAGFFAISSYESKGLWRFIVSKLKRLGIPLTVGSIFIGPMLPYIGYWSQNFNGLESTGYWDFWLNYMKSFGHPGMTGGRATAEPLFYYQHFWFILVLLVLFLMFGPLYTLWKKVTATFKFTLIKSEVPSNASILLVIFLFPYLAGAGYNSGFSNIFSSSAYIRNFFILFALLILFDPLYDFGKIIHAKVFSRHTINGPNKGALRLFSKLFGAVVLGIIIIIPGIYANKYGRNFIRAPGLPAYFALGLYAYSKKWFINGKAPSPVVLWGIASLVCVLGNRAVTRELSFLPAYRTLVWFSGQYLIVALLGLLGAVTFRYMNRPSSINGKFAASSFSIFIIHFPIVASMQFLMLEWGIPVPAKFMICAVVSILTSFAISNYIIRQFPRLSVAGLIGVFALMSLFLNPGRSADAAGETAITESAPTAGQSSKPNTQNNERRIESQIRILDKQLDLSDDQKTKYRVLITKQMNTYEVILKQFDKQLDEILTEKQKKKYREMRGGR